MMTTNEMITARKVENAIFVKTATNIIVVITKPKQNPSTKYSLFLTLMINLDW